MEISSNPSQMKINWKSFGPGILLASAAIGGSHLIASTQAGALYGWQLAIIIILANLFKYPFFRFATDYVYDTGDSLIAGYAKKSKVYLWVYFILIILSAAISTGAITLLTSTILNFLLPESLGVSSMVLSGIVTLVSLAFLLLGHYKMLDKVTKVIMLVLTLATVLAVFIAAGKPTHMAADFIPSSPWNWASLGFIIALMGWMPTPLEFAAISSMWTSQKIRDDHTTHQQGLLDFNVGYISSTILALLFLALGVFVQYGSGQPIQMQGGQYVGQLISMYTETIGDWSKLLVAFIAFMCMFGTLLTVVDGYGRGISECWRLINHQPHITRKQIAFWVSFSLITGFIIISYFTGQLGIMIKFAMISAFVSAPIFAWLNYSLVKSEQKISAGLNLLSILGLIFLLGFSILFIINFMFLS